MTERPEGENSFAAKAMPWVRRAISLGIVGYVLWRLTHFGWGELLANLPQNPAFYVVQVIAYTVLPVCEIIIFSKLFKRNLRSQWPVFLRKRALNNSVLGYSGEAYLVFWAKDRLGLRRRDALSYIKDNVLLSGFTTAAFAIMAAGALILLHPKLLAKNELMQTSEKSFLLFAILFGIALVAGHFFRRKLFGIGTKVILLVAAIHAMRLVIKVRMHGDKVDVILDQLSDDAAHTGGGPARAGSGRRRCAALRDVVLLRHRSDDPALRRRIYAGQDAEGRELVSDGRVCGRLRHDDD
mgnify:CR=1 FL=1